MTISEFRRIRLPHSGALRREDLEWRPQSPRALQCLQEVDGPGIARRKVERGNPVRPYKLGWYHEQALTKPLQSSSLQMGWNTETFEPVQQVVGQQHDLEECLVGLEVVGGNFAQGIGVFQFSDNQLRPRSLVVEPPKVEGLQREISDHGLVGVAAHLEQGALCRRFFRHRSADHDEASRPGPTQRTIFELCCPHSRRDPMVVQSRQPVFQRSGKPGHDGVKSSFSLDEFDDFVIVEGGVGPNSDFADRCWQLAESALEQGNVMVETLVRPG